VFAVGRYVGFGVVAGGWLCVGWCPSDPVKLPSDAGHTRALITHEFSFFLETCSMTAIILSILIGRWLTCRAEGRGGTREAWHGDLEYSSFWHHMVSPRPEEYIFIPEPTVRAWPYNQQCISTPLSSSKQIRRYALGKFLFPDTIVVPYYKDWIDL